MTLYLGHMMTPSGLSVGINGQIHVIPVTHPNWDKIMVALKEKAYDTLEPLLDLGLAVKQFFIDAEGFSVDGGIVSLDGEEFSEDVSHKVLRMIESGSEATGLLNFLRKVRLNPSNAAQRELLLFAVANGFLIHEDGDVITFKGVREDYMDCQTGTISNTVGQVVSMPRHKVDDRRNVTCSHGLHAGSLSFASGYGSRTVILKINPADFVSIPDDYQNQKARVCRYEVISELVRSETFEQKEVYHDSDFSDDYDDSEKGPLDQDDESDEDENDEDENDEDDSDDESDEDDDSRN